MSSRPSVGRGHRLASLFCLVLLGFAAQSQGQTSSGTDSKTNQPQTDNGIATKTSAQAFQSGSARAAQGAEPGQPTAPKPSTAASILVLPKPLPPEITKDIDVSTRSKAILAHLSEVLRFYRMAIAPIQKIGEPSDMLYAEQAEAQATEAAQLAFQGARDEAALLARIPGQSGNTQVPERLQRLNQIRTQAAQRVQQLQQQQDSLNQQIAKAKAADRGALQQQLETTKGQLELNTAMANALAKVAGVSATEGTTGLETQISQLQSSAPELANPKAKPVTHTVENLTSRDSGVTSLASVLFQLLSTEHAIEDRMAETQKLHDQAIELRSPLLNIMRATMQAGQQMQTQPVPTDASGLSQTRKRYDELTDAFNAISKVSIPISQELLVVEQLRSTLETWRGSVDSERKTVLRSLLMRVIFIAVALTILFVINLFARRATMRYVTDIRRRRHLVLVRRLVLGFLTFIVLLFGFVTQFSSLATFAGFITAGIAVGLQTILLSVAAYFFIIGRYGIKVGDRITVANVTGDVVDVGLARFYMMELTGTGTELHPTGRVAVLANSVLFQAGTPLYKQVPGTEYAWHELTVKIKPNVDYRAATEAVLQAVSGVYATYKNRIDAQHREVEEWMDTPIETPHVESRLQLSDGLEFVVLYPVEIRDAAATDEKVVQAVLNTIHSNEKITDAIDGTPSVKAVVKG